MDIVRPKITPENEPQRYREGPIEPPSKEELEAFYRNARLSIPTGIRLPMATMLSYGAGFVLGASHGSKMAGLRFRAEHAHKLPNSTTGWYLYHKSKNYHVMKGGVREGLKMGFKVSLLTTAMFSIEQMFDTYRGTADLFNTVTSSVTVAGAFSLWTKTTSPLAVLPLKNVLRSWMTTTVSSSPILLPPSLKIMSALAHTTSPAFNPDSNPLLKALLKKTFYAQFCAGESPTEVQHTIRELKDIGFQGVILGYAREVVIPHGSQSKNNSSAVSIQSEVEPWANGTLETVRLASAGDFVALKFTGAGSQALAALRLRQEPPKELADAIEAICDLAKKLGVRLLFDAEQTAVQGGIDDWTMRYMRKYNADEPGKAVIYGTYQAYLKKAPETLSAHLKQAKEEGFTLGVKLVRGAYLGSDPREVIHDTKEDTDRAYDGIARALLKREWETPLVGNSRFPDVAVVLATHNRGSVLKAKRMIASGEADKRTDVAFAQLQGMADEVSCELVAGKKQGDVKANAYKYLVWGTTGECMKYLLRRAYENKDAVQRTVSGREAMKSEVLRRVKELFGMH
ncbi:FAD-linked oxidoreductase-like protein [Podospora fimiseda]|uniref:Proline dehydrogenase n=1 Tax=Podospora fimiseda TaxID=252190 RepID=A0AAN7BIE1_9PEZI|nr:FAD-linked oxidoreductase-like protein [Podospora fimiseda]